MSEKTYEFEVVREHAGSRETVLKTSNLLYATTFADQRAKREPNCGFRVWRTSNQTTVHCAGLQD